MKDTILPDFLTIGAPNEPSPPKPLSPSKPSEETPVVQAPSMHDALKRGQQIHTLLEYIPSVAKNKQEQAIRIYLEAQQVDKTQIDKVSTRLLKILHDERFAPLFGPESKAEVPVIGVLGKHVVSGQIDRLAVVGDTVLIVDYKTNRMPPASVDTVPRAYLKQMAAYQALLQKIYPDKHIQCALLWVESLCFMPLPALETAACLSETA